MGQFLKKMYDEDLAIQENAIKESFINPKVSIIVPVYNSNEYLFKCLFSLIKQTLKEIEIIIIDNSSNNDSTSIISRFKNADFRIKVLTQINHKQALAKNNIMNIAKGEYFCFINSCDWVNADYFKKLYAAAKKYDSDIALASNIKNQKEEFVTTLQEKFDICNLHLDSFSTNKIFKSGLIKENKISWSEDEEFLVQAIYFANGVVTVLDVYSVINSKTFINKNKLKAQALNLLKNKNFQIRDKDFWLVEFEIRIFNIAIFKILKSLKTKRIFLFGLKLMDLTLRSQHD